MKKFISVAVAVLAMFVIASCQSNGPFTQDDANAAFEKIYSRYASGLILDDATEYTVQSGDTLSKISRTAFGADYGYYFPVIMLASKDVVLDPDLIKPGMKLTIPNLQTNLASTKAKNSMKSFFKDVADVYRRKGNDTVQTALMDISNSL